jgi:hypothetical protein
MFCSAHKDVSMIKVSKRVGLSLPSSIYRAPRAHIRGHLTQSLCTDRMRYRVHWTRPVTSVPSLWDSHVFWPFETSCCRPMAPSCTLTTYWLDTRSLNRTGQPLASDRDPERSRERFCRPDSPDIRSSLRAHLQIVNSPRGASDHAPWPKSGRARAAGHARVRH